MSYTVDSREALVSLVQAQPGKRFWIFGNGNGARFLYAAWRDSVNENLAGFVCAEGLNCSLGMSKPETDLAADDVVLVASQYVGAISARIASCADTEIVDCTPLLQQLMRECQTQLAFVPLEGYTAPYPLQKYADTLQALLQSSTWSEYADIEINTPASRFTHRYDIDTDACCKNMARMLDIALEKGIKPAVYIRTDGLEFDFRQLQRDVQAYSVRGIFFGLHTSCYIHEDYVSALCEEIQRFTDAFGFAPRGLTVHGLGELHKERRVEAGEFIAANKSQLGLEYADIPRHFRHYHHVLQDCNFASDGVTRQLYTDFQKITDLSAYPIDLLLLVHPCYWVE